MPDAEGSAPERLSYATPLSRLANLMRAHAGHFSPLEQAVAYTVVGFMQRDGTRAFPSLATVARILGISTRSVNRALRVLARGPLPIFTVQHRGRRSSIFSLITSPGAFVVGRAKAAVKLFPPEARARCTARKASEGRATATLPGRVTGQVSEEVTPDHLPDCVKTEVLTSQQVQAPLHMVIPKARRSLAEPGEDVAAVLAKIRAQLGAPAPSGRPAVEDPPAECSCSRMIVKRTTPAGETERRDFDVTTGRVGGVHSCLGPGQADSAALERHGCRREQGVGA